MVIRPTFSEILDILRANEFEISPECDSSVTSSYVEGIERENEARWQHVFDFRLAALSQSANSRLPEDGRQSGKLSFRSEESPDLSLTSATSD
jgi:hypothetical protein